MMQEILGGMTNCGKRERTCLSRPEACLFCPFGPSRVAASIELRYPYWERGKTRVLMSFDRIAEQKIREAMENGEFDNLSGSGKPLQELDAYFSTPEDLRLGYWVLKSSGFVPEEVSVLREIGLLKEQIRDCAESEKRTRIDSEIRHLQLKYDLIMDRYRRVSRWR
jgi:hypothetical protein